MKYLLASALILTAACASTHAPQSTSQPGHGALTIQIVPNPIVAKSMGGSKYVFPFDVVLRETGGHPVTITRVRADVTALGGIHVATESYDAAKIASLGFSTQVPPNGELRYHFSPEESVPDDRLFGGVVAELTAEGVDDTGAPTMARISVTVTK